MIGFLGATSSFLPMFRLDIIYPFGNFGITIYVFILAYAILRQKLLELNLIFKKSIVYSLSAGILTGFFILLVLAITEVLSVFIGVRSFTVNVISAIIIAILFNPVKNKIQYFIDKIFYKTTYDYYGVIQRVSCELASAINLKHINKLIVETICSTLKLESGYLLTAENNHFKVIYSSLFKDRHSVNRNIPTQKIPAESPLITLIESRDEIVFKDELFMETEPEKAEIIGRDLKSFDGYCIAPIIIEGMLKYILIFGKRMSGEPFSHEDINLVNTIKDEAAVALKNAGLYHELERRVQEKTEELRRSHAQLVQSEKMSATGQLAAGLAHELNSPLTGLISLVRVYRKKAGKDSKEYEHMSSMLKPCEYMSRIVKDFNTFSRKSSGVLEPVNAHEAIQGALTLAAYNIKQKDIVVMKNFAPSLPNVTAEKAELQQVMLNIILNAVDAMDERGTLIMKTGLTEDGSRVFLEFSDSGCGIMTEDLDRIYNPFFTTKEQGKGIGLGLSVSYGIIKNFGGEIRAESMRGVGSKFTVLLPVNKQEKEK
jgi:signal transduction histidine kinase